MDNLLPFNQPSKPIRQPTLKRNRLSDSQNGKVRYKLWNSFNLLCLFSSFFSFYYSTIFSLITTSFHLSSILNFFSPVICFQFFQILLNYIQNYIYPHFYCAPLKYFHFWFPIRDCFCFNSVIIVSVHYMQGL